MPLEPKECRLQALTCERLAQRSTSPIVKGAYADLAKKWIKVADDLQAAINARAEPESQGQTA
jgi:molecular chaperone GrpE (heat shock protein)